MGAGNVCWSLLACIALLLGVAVVQMNWRPRVDLPDHLLHHTAIFLPELLTREEAADLLNLAKDMREFPTNVADLKFYDTVHEHIGEATPIGPNGTCEHAYLVPSSTKTQCVLPGRIDIGRHFILAGGVEGIKEEYDDIVSRLQSFGRYMFDLTEYPIIERLFSSDIFQENVKKICPSDKQVLDPFQFNFIVQVPGQTVALHVDGVYFWGATRFHFPQWLLAVMQFSGLFSDEFVDQIQVVSYFHEWEDREGKRGGEFVYWNDERQVPSSQLPLARAGSFVDGSKVVHAATIYRPELKAPRMDKSHENVLVYMGKDTDTWELRSNGKTLQSFSTDDLRWTIVYRARCFESEEKLEHFHNLPEDEIMTLDSILSKLTDDMKKRGALSSSYDFRAQSSPSERLALAEALLDTYVRYPMPVQSLIPYNYCVLPRLLPWTAPLISLIC